MLFVAKMMDELEVQEARPRGSLDFAETSVLGMIVPLDSNLSIEQALKGSVERLDNDNDSPIAAIPQRQAVFFG